MTLSCNRGLVTQLMWNEIGHSSNKRSQDYLLMLKIKNMQSNFQSLKLDYLFHAFDFCNILHYYVNCSNAVKCWNWKTGTPIWERGIDPYELGKTVKIVANYVLCLTEFKKSLKNPSVYKIRIFDIEKKEQVGIIDGISENPLTEHVCAIGSRIFTLMKNGNIYEWNMKGEYINCIKGKVSKIKDFFSFGKFIIQIKHSKVAIYNLQTKLREKVELFTSPGERASISSTDVYNDHLICTFEYSNKACVINLETAIVDYIECPLQVRIHDYLKTVKLNKKEAYLGSNLGEIYVYNLQDKTTVELGKHTSSINKLISKGRFLISHSLNENSSTLKFWDTHTRLQIKEISKIPYSLSAIKLDSDSLTALGSPINGPYLKNASYRLKWDLSRYRLTDA